MRSASASGEASLISAALLPGGVDFTEAQQLDLFTEAQPEAGLTSTTHRWRNNRNVNEDSDTSRCLGPRCHQEKLRRSDADVSPFPEPGACTDEALRRHDDINFDFTVTAVHFVGSAQGRACRRVHLCCRVLIRPMGGTASAA